MTSITVIPDKLPLTTITSLKSKAKNEEELQENLLMSTAMPNTSHLPTGVKRSRFDSMLGGVIGGIVIALLAVGIVIIHCLLSFYLCYRKCHQANQEKVESLSRGNGVYKVHNNFMAAHYNIIIFLIPHFYTICSFMLFMCQ